MEEQTVSGGVEAVWLWNESINVPVAAKWHVGWRLGFPHLLWEGPVYKEQVILQEMAHKCRWEAWEPEHR